MISAHQATLIRGLTESSEFASLLEEIAMELFQEWTQNPDEEDREKIYYQYHATTLLADVIAAKLHDLTSGDTNA